MSELNIILQFMFYVTSLGFISLFDYLAKRKLGVASRGYFNIRLPKFIALAICSLTAIVAVVLANKGLFTVNLANFFSVPYFAAISYFMVVFFREVKVAHKQ